MHEVPRQCETAAEGAEESKDGREVGSKGQDGRKKGGDLSVVFFFLLGKDEGSAEEPGAHGPAAGSHGRLADFCGHTKPAVGELWTRWDGGLVGLLVVCFSWGLRGNRVVLPSASRLTSRLAKFDSKSPQKS